VYVSFLGCRNTALAAQAYERFLRKLATAEMRAVQICTHEKVAKRAAKQDTADEERKKDTKIAKPGRSRGRGWTKRDLERRDLPRLEKAVENIRRSLVLISRHGLRSRLIYQVVQA
jgi:hypothetical protein